MHKNISTGWKYKLFNIFKLSDVSTTRLRPNISLRLSQHLGCTDIHLAICPCQVKTSNIQYRIYNSKPVITASLSITAYYTVEDIEQSLTDIVKGMSQVLKHAPKLTKYVIKARGLCEIWWNIIWWRYDDAGLCLKQISEPRIQWS